MFEKLQNMPLFQLVAQFEVANQVALLHRNVNNYFPNFNQIVITQPWLQPNTVKFLNEF